MERREGGNCGDDQSTGENCGGRGWREEKERERREGVERGEGERKEGRGGERRKRGELRRGEEGRGGERVGQGEKGRGGEGIEGDEGGGGKSAAVDHILQQPTNNHDGEQSFAPLTVHLTDCFCCCRDFPMLFQCVALRPLLLLCLFLLSFSNCSPEKAKRRFFEIDYTRHIFLKDGQPFRYISGECLIVVSLPIHLYIHPSLWEDRLFRIRAAGLNAVQLYIPWNFHEEQQGRVNFGDDRNISRFIHIAQQNELYVLIRMGPYVCAELEFGGLPWWLIKDQANITLRSSEKTYLRHVHRWLSVLLPVLQPLLYKNGGPILMIQLENEYGSISVCDHDYMRWLRDFVKETLGEDVVLYTTDGAIPQLLRCGSIEGTFATVDFGPQRTEKNVKEIFQLQRKHSKGGPPVNSEFYTTWFSMWGDKAMVRQEMNPVLSTMDFMWAQNASFNLYMIHGGTSFAFWSGRETNGPVITSYDYAAPISEAGQITPLYEAIRNWINSKPSWPNRPLALPNNRTGISIQNVFGVKLHNFITLTNASSPSLDIEQGRCIHSSDGPLNFEAFSQDHGLVWYSATLETEGQILEMPVLRDHAYVYLDGIFQGNLSVSDKTGGRTTLPLRGSGGKRGQKIDIMVENIGRLTYPLSKVDPKGLFSPPFIDGKVISKRWVQCGVNLDNLHVAIDKTMAEKGGRKINNGQQRQSLPNKSPPAVPHEPTIFAAKFPTPNLDWSNMHTFLDTRGWGHGIALVNGLNLGRYWPTQGPQLTLFVPGAVLKLQNLVILVELEWRQKDDSLINFLSDPVYTWSPNDARSVIEPVDELLDQLQDKSTDRRMELISDSRPLHKHRHRSRHRDTFNGDNGTDFFAHF